MACLVGYEVPPHLMFKVGEGGPGCFLGVGFSSVGYWVYPCLSVDVCRYVGMWHLVRHVGFCGV